VDFFPIERDGSCLIVAEMGTGHGGDLQRAFEMIDAASEAGADCAKLQLVFADEILHPLTGRIDLPGGSVALYERFKELERDESFYRELKNYTESRGLLFLCTPFGQRSARMLRSIGCRALKIASPELNHLPLLREVASYGVPLILSTGVSYLADIEKAVGITGRNVTLLHCITQYPAPEEEYNLKLIPNLSAIFGLPVGVSDHSLDPRLVPAMSVGLGARIVEKHFTLSSEGGGLDDPIALTPSGFSTMVEAVRKAEGMSTHQTIDWLSDEYGNKRVEKVLGTGRKELALGERAAYGRSNRSIHAVDTIHEGQLITRDRVALLRSERNLRPGLTPEFLDVVLGKRARRTVPAGQGIVWDDLL
jgi:sialic acid synthase SpsE